ncbi:MAG: serine hydrolase [Acidobacteria bacterium]|nr:serine hydrolase [Acidobacteriota bacterium]
MLRWVLAVSLLTTSLAAQTGPLQQDLREQLQRRLDGIASRLDGTLGFAVVDLTSNERVAARLPMQPFPTASTIKLSILYELLKQAEEGKLALNQPARLERRQVAAGSGVLQHLSAPLLSLADHAALMMIVSDNTATNVVIEAVGMANVNARTQAMGMPDILLRRKMMDAAAVKRGDENVASPASLVKSVEVLWRGDGLTKDSRDAGVQILYKVGGAIRGAVPSRVRVASKTGTLEGVRAEAAVVELEGRPFALAAMTTYLRHDPDGERAIGDVADAAFSYFERLALGGAYGRKAP